MNKLTNNQLIHRAYLQSDLWKSIRLKALEFYGCKCNRCGDFGNDVHHKTYERVGGYELLEDLEVLCRDCHKAHHALDGVASKRVKGKRGLHFKVIFGRLKLQHKDRLREKFGFIADNDIYLAILNKSHVVIMECLKMLKCDYYFGSTIPKKNSQIARRYGVAKSCRNKSGLFKKL